MPNFYQNIKHNFNRFLYNEYILIGVIFIVSRTIYLGIGYFFARKLNPFDKSATGMPFLVRWDSIFFVEIAKHGYRTEQSLAFFPLLPMIIRCISKTCKIEVMLAGILLNNILFFMNTLIILYISSIIVPGNEFVATMFYVFSPASVIYSSIYTESLFTFLFLQGFLFYIWSYRPGKEICKTISMVTKEHLSNRANIADMVAHSNSSRVCNKKMEQLGTTMLLKRRAYLSEFKNKMVNIKNSGNEIIKPKEEKHMKRSRLIKQNEILRNNNDSHGKYKIYYFICLFIFGISGLCRSNAILFALIPLLHFKNLFQFVSESLICISGFLAFQVYSFFRIKGKHIFPYNYIQGKYWEQGFLRFYMYKKNIPNFFVGLPFILFFSVYLYKLFIAELRKFNFYRGKKGIKKRDRESVFGYIFSIGRDLYEYYKRKRHILFLVSLLFIQVILAIFFVHSHMILRFVAYNPLIYWFLADFYNSNTPFSRFVVFIYFNWSVIYTILFCCYYPPA